MPTDRKHLDLPCGHRLSSQNAPGPDAQKVHAYRFARDAQRHRCELVSPTDPSGFVDKRPGE